MNNKNLYDFFQKQLKNLIEIDSVSGSCDYIQDYIQKVIVDLGFNARSLNKGGLLVNIGGQDDPLVVTAHADTIGLIVKNINTDGTIEILNIGRLPEFAAENANVCLYTLSGAKYYGTIRRKWSCIHVTPLELRNDPASYENNLILKLDEDVKDYDSISKLGIQCGDIVALEPKMQITNNGYIKSYFLDDKVNVAIMLTYLQHLYLVRNTIKSDLLKRKVYFYFSMHEEVMHGGAIKLPEDVTEILALDVCCVCKNQNSDEHSVTICAADSRFPYNRKMIKKLVILAKENNINYNLDIFYPTYGTDADLALLSGNDVRHALIGPGVIGTHAYERTHVDAIINTYNLLVAYIEKITGNKNYV